MTGPFILKVEVEAPPFEETVYLNPIEYDKLEAVSKRSATKRTDENEMDDENSDGKENVSKKTDTKNSSSKKTDAKDKVGKTLKQKKADSKNMEAKPTVLTTKAATSENSVSA